MIKTAKNKSFSCRCTQTDLDVLSEMKHAAGLLGFGDDVIEGWPRVKWLWFALDVLMRSMLKGEIAQGQIDGCEDISGLFVMFMRARRGMAGYSLTVDAEGDLWVSGKGITCS